MYVGETGDLAEILEENAKGDTGKAVPGMVRTDWRPTVTDDRSTSLVT